MSLWQLPGIGLSVLLAWLSLALLALAVRSWREVNPHHQHWLLLLALFGSIVPVGLVWLVRQSRELQSPEREVTGVIAIVNHGFDVTFPDSIASFPLSQSVKFNAVTGWFTKAQGFIETAGWLAEALTAVASVWLVAVAIVTVRWCSRWARLARIRRRAQHASPWLVARAEILSRRHRIARAPVLVSDDISLPFAMGFLRPVVLFPREFLEHANTRDLDFALSHELLHLARHDTRIAVCIQAFTVAFVGHPAARWFATEIAVMREACVDARASREQPHAYAHFLLSLADRLSEATKSVPAAVAMADTTLARRIHLMTQPSTAKRGVFLHITKLVSIEGLLIAIGLGVGFACAGIDAAPRANRHNQSTEESAPLSSGGESQGSALAQGSLPKEAQVALQEAAEMASNCMNEGEKGPRGEGSVRMNYSAAGDFESVTLLTGRFRDTRTGGCVRRMFRQAAFRPSGAAPLASAASLGGARFVQWGFQVGETSQ